MEKTESKIIDYTIYRSSSNFGYESAIKKMLKEGWSLFGGGGIAVDKDGHHWFYQTLVKYEKTE